MAKKTQSSDEIFEMSCLLASVILPQKSEALLALLRRWGS